MHYIYNSKVNVNLHLNLKIEFSLNLKKLASALVFRFLEA